jgi:hypothetical protein
MEVVLQHLLDFRQGFTDAVLARLCIVHVDN